MKLKTEINEEIIEYCNIYGVRETNELKNLRLKTLELSNNQMLITPVQGAFLKLLVQISQAKNILEIGMFTGYSALWMSLGLPINGKLVTLDINDAHLDLAKTFWELAGVNDKITPIIGEASTSIQNLTQSKQQFDLIFIDANKADYIEYYNSAIKILNPNGLIIIDNVFMYGQVLEQSPQKKYVMVLQQLNTLIQNDDRVDICMLPIGDGLTLARKKDSK